MTYFIVAFGLAGVLAVVAWRVSEAIDDAWQRIVWGLNLC